MSSTRRILGLEQRGKKQKMKRKDSKMISDERFASAQSDPRFMDAPKKHSKITIDSRFQRIFTDRSFIYSRAPVDKRGRPKTKNASSSLAHYYHLQQENVPEVDSEVSQIGKQTESGSNSTSEKLRTLEGNDDDDDDVDDDDDDDGDVQSVDESSSTSTTDSDDDNYVDEEEEDTPMLQENNVPEIDKETRRLAIVNLDWSQVRAIDLYVLLTSFLPKGGQILSASVYPSEFGLKRMEEEAVCGPVGLFDDEDKHDDVDDDEIDQTKLRAYELSRLRYYYAVVECDSVATADYLYKTCDGVEFERSANKLDLRFVPDSMDFKRHPRDVATEVPADYEGLDFQTRALQHSNIHLTWDEDEPQRSKTFKRKLDDEQMAELELKEYLASDESESDEDEVEDKSEKKCNKLDKYRALIQSADGSDNDEEDGNGQDMEVTFSSGLEEISNRILEKKKKKSESVWDAYLRKSKEKRKASKKGSKYTSDEEHSESGEEAVAEEADDFFVEDTPAEKKRGRKSANTTEEREASRAELELLTADDKFEDTNLKGYNLKPKKRKGKRGKEIPEEGKTPSVDYEDPRFSALFTSPDYAPDPTDPQYKRSAPYHRLKQHKSTQTREDL